MNLLNLIENTTAGYDNLRALMQAVQTSQDAVLNVGGEPITLEYPEARFMLGKYKSYNKAGRQDEFLRDLGDPVRFDLHMKQLRQLIDKQKNFRGSVPGERGVTGDVPQGIAEETVEEITAPNPNKPTAQTAGKINWERMIKDYMDNKPYSEFEFVDDRPLTLYRSQVYAILKDFGRMKPPQKINIILNTFGDKIAMVDYIDKLRAKGMMPKKVPAYVAPGTEPVSPGQMELPGMPAPRIKEAQAQKKNSEQPELDKFSAINPRVARAMQLARARQASAATDTEAMVADFVDQQELDQAKFDKVQSVNRRQDALLKQVTAINQQQDQEIDSLEDDNVTLQNNLKQIQAVNAELAKKLGVVSQRRSEEPPVQKVQPTEPVAAPEPQAQPAEPPLQQPVPQQRPKTRAPAKKRTTKKKPQPAPAGNVLQFPQGGRGSRQAQPDSDEISSALQGVDIGDELATGTFGLKEEHRELHAGDPVIIKGNSEFKGKTGDIVDFGRDRHFVIVDLYNFGKHAFHASNVQYNDYADQEVDEAETHDKTGAKMHQAKEKFLLRHNGKDIAFFNTAEEAKQAAQELMRDLKGTATVQRVMREMQTKLDRYNVNQPPPGGTNKQREAFLDARDRLFRQMNGASPGEREAIRLKIADLEGQAQAQGIRIRESDDLNRAGYNAIKSVDDWQEKIRVMRELMKDPALMSDPEARSAIEQRIGDLIRVGQQQGYVTEALNDKAMAVLRGLKQPAQSQTPASVSPEKQAEIDQWAQDFQRNVAGPMGRQVVPAPAPIDLNVPDTPKARRGRPSNAERAQRHQEFLDLRKRIEQLDQLIKMKEQIDKLFIKAQNVRGGIYPGLQADIEAEELYPVPQTDQDYEDLKAKYAKDLDALQKFLAMKKAVYREDEDSMLGESTALVRLKQARQQLAQQGVAEAKNQDRYELKITDQWEDEDPESYGTMDEYEFDVLKNGRSIGRARANNYFADLYVDLNNGKQLKLSHQKHQSHPLMKEYERLVWGLDEQGVAEATNNDWDDADEFGMPGSEFFPEKQPRGHYKVYYMTATDHKLLGRYATQDEAEQRVKELKAEYPDNQFIVFASQRGMTEAQTDYQKRRQRERDVDAGRSVKALPKNPQTDYAKKRAKDRRDMEMGEGTAQQFGQAVRMAGYTGRELEKDPKYKKDVQHNQQELAQRQKNLDRVAKGYGDEDDQEPWLKEQGVPFDQCPQCGGKIVHESELTEKQDACYHKVKSRYKVWPSAYASGALVQCRKKGAANWGNGGKKK